MGGGGGDGVEVGVGWGAVEDAKTELDTDFVRIPVPPRLAVYFADSVSFHLWSCLDILSSRSSPVVFRLLLLLFLLYSGPF